MKRKMSKKQRGTIILNTFAAIFCVIAVTTFLMPQEMLREYAWIMLGACAVTLAVALYGFFLRWKAWIPTTVHAFVKNIDENVNKLGFQKVIFEMENGELLTLDVHKQAICFSEGDIGFLQYEKLESETMFFKKFKNEGKSASLSNDATMGKKCGNCGAALVYGKFCAEPICEYCTH